MLRGYWEDFLEVSQKLNLERRIRVRSWRIENRASLVAQMVKNLPAMQETHVHSLGWEIPWRKKGLAAPWTEEPGGLQSMGSQRTELLTQQQRKEVRKIPDIET